jgi:succinate dehydrogenase / fumarate reductase cytochrome b subunit
MTATRQIPFTRVVPPLQPGLSRSFVLRRLHFLSGIVPVGAFLVEHFASNAFATNGPKAYGEQVRMLTGLPFLVWIEALFIWIPILFHSLYGFYIWHRGDSNVVQYPLVGNWMYTAQRWTGGVTFAYMLYHTVEMRFLGVELRSNPDAGFGKVQLSFQNPWILAFYMVGVVAASWHFGYGLYLFAVKWGLVAGDNARRRLGTVCFGIVALLIVIGLLTIRAFLNWPPQPLNAPSAFIVVRCP